jgi:carboxyl-terminal processing protease
MNSYMNERVDTMNTKRLTIVVVFLFVLSCVILPQAPTAVRPTVPPATETPLPVSVYTPPDCLGQPLATLPAATTIAEPTPSLGANPTLTQSQQLAVFEELIAPIPSLYIYPDFNGLDWPATVAKYRANVESGLDTETFYNQMVKLISELGDDHSQFESPVMVAADQAELAGVNNFVGIGIFALPMVDKSKVSILAVFPGSPAEHAGLKPHDSILAVDGIPLVENGKSHVMRLRGPECSAAVLTVQSPGKASRNVTLVRYKISAPTPVIAQLVPTQDGSHIGYIFLPSFFDETIPGQVRQALQNFGNLDGLIIDNRMNSGGITDVLYSVLGFFTSGTLGHFASRTATRPLDITADPVNNSQTVPLVVLVGVDTVSFGEVSSGALQDIGRAKIVGQTTLGNVEVLLPHDLSDGSQLWLAEERFVPLHSQANWEQTGIIPDVTAYADWDTFTFQNDPSIAAAVKLLGHK